MTLLHEQDLFSSFLLPITRNSATPYQEAFSLTFLTNILILDHFVSSKPLNNIREKHTRLDSIMAPTIYVVRHAQGHHNVNVNQLLLLALFSPSDHLLEPTSPT